MDKTKRPAEWHERVLSVLKKNSVGMSAYEVLDALKVFNPKIAPPTVYRALNALTEQGRVHRLESKNAYVACRSFPHQHTPVFSVCDGCGLVEECMAPQVLSALSEVASKTGFAPTHQVIEVRGRCVACRDAVAL